MRWRRGNKTRCSDSMSCLNMRKFQMTFVGAVETSRNFGWASLNKLAGHVRQKYLVGEYVWCLLPTKISSRAAWPCKNSYLTCSIGAHKHPCDPGGLCDWSELCFLQVNDDWIMIGLRARQTAVDISCSSILEYDNLLHLSLARWQAYPRTSNTTPFCRSTPRQHVDLLQWCGPLKLIIFSSSRDRSPADNTSDDRHRRHERYFFAVVFQVRCGAEMRLFSTYE